jgi:ubiquitin-protein ligase
MESVIEIIDNWNTKNNLLKKYTQDKNTIELFYENVSFKFILPDKSQDFITVDSDYDISWLDNLNMKIIEKNYSSKNLDKILTIICNQLKKVNKTYSKKKNTKIVIDDMKIIDENEIKVLSMKKKVNDLILEKINDKTQSTTSSDKKLFDKETVLKIIGEEFIDLYTTSLKTNKFKIHLNENNIVSWKIQLTNFSDSKIKKDLANLKDKFGYDYIEFNISFNQELYPNYPPKIDFVKPKFQNSLNYKLSNLRMLQLDYWSPARTVEFIINKLHAILNKFGSIDLINANSSNSIVYSKLEQALISLCNHFEQIEDELDDEKYEKNTFKSVNSKPPNGKYWKSGTGYGHNGVKSWDIDAYVLSQKQKDQELVNLLNVISKEIEDVTESNKETIKHSFLMKYFNSKFQGNTLFEMNKHNELYMKYADILNTLLNSYSNEINSDDLVKFNSIISEIYSEISLAAKLGTQDEFSIKYTLIHTKCEELVKEIKKKEETKDTNSEVVVLTSIQEKYKSSLDKYKFVESPIIFNGCKYHFKDNFDKLSGKRITYHKRMVQELGILRKSVPVDFGASIYVAMDPENISVLRVLITGPHDTPYDSACFIFDVFIPENFPNGPPLVYMLNTGNVRFNPNLYNCGKVCLSILGTWNGDKGESWNKETSSLFQVFMSIQSLILIDEPYFNEPGYESSIGTSKGKEDSYNYNNKIRMYSMRHAMKNLLTSNEYPQFTEVIKEHFKLKKDHILKVCQKWVDDAPEKLNNNNHHSYNKDNLFTKKDYEIQYKELKEVLDKL